MPTFDEVYRKHVSVVLRVAARAVGRYDIAEELAAEAFLALHRQFDRIDTEQLPGWLLTVVRRRATDYWRRQKLEQLWMRDPAAAREPAVRPVEVSDDLFAHTALKQVHKACLVLRYRYDMSREEIASRLGLTETQVRGHLQYALTLLRKNMEPKESRP